MPQNQPNEPFTFQTFEELFARAHAMGIRVSPRVEREMDKQTLFAGSLVALDLLRGAPAVGISITTAKQIADMLTTCEAPVAGICVVIAALHLRLACEKNDWGHVRIGVPNAWVCDQKRLRGAAPGLALAS